MSRPRYEGAFESLPTRKQKKPKQKKQQQRRRRRQQQQQQGRAPALKRKGAFLIEPTSPKRQAATVDPGSCLGRQLDSAEAPNE